ncbi:MAG: type VI secretion system baseplate subunit TssG [Pseudomonadota bacterium]
MASDHRHAPPDLSDLQAKARSTEFYEVLRRLEQPGLRFGRSGGAGREPARLGQHIRMAFATSDVEALDVPSDGSTPRVSVNAVGLFGPEGPMPLHLTKWIMDRASNRWFAGDQTGASADRAFLNFANVLQHRAIAFYWRAWADMQPGVQFPHDNGGSVGAMVRALAGLGLTEDGRAGEASHAKLRHATSLFQRVESPRRLLELLRSETGYRVELVEFVGVWNVIPDRLQSRLGRTAVRLGDSAVIGKRFFDRGNRVELRLGPLNRDEYLSFLDDPKKQGTLRDALRFASGGAMQFDVRLMLAEGDVPQPRLSSARLGQTTWIGHDGKTVRGDLVLRDFANAPRRMAA